MAIMSSPVDTFLLENIPSVSPNSTIVTALALMEVHNSSYIFLIANGVYEGVVTRQVIARRMLDCIQEMEKNNGLSR
ncbi:MAG: CBS domain-containing protein, partial [Gammaproteobacteria bacterium]